MGYSQCQAQNCLRIFELAVGRTHGLAISGGLESRDRDYEFSDRPTGRSHASPTAAYHAGSIPVTKEPKNRVQDFGYRVPRFPADFHLLLQTNEPEPRVLDARCTDISVDGIAVQMPEHLKVGVRVTLVLTLPGSSTSLRIGGRVAYQRNDEHGFAFIFSSPEERESVQKQLSSAHLQTLSLTRPRR